MAIRWAFFLITGLLGLGGCGGGDPMSGFQRGETGRVVRVIDGDAVVLDTGQSVRLVGVEAPAFGRNGAPDEPHAAEARRRLEDMVLGRRVRLYYSGLTRDRYDRALAHLCTEDRLGPVVWVNLELVSAGAVRVRVYPDTASGSDALFAAEAGAMAARRGLWARRAYAVKDARDLADTAPGFLILSGILGPRRPGPFEDTACARSLLGSEVMVTVDLPAMAACDLETGQRVQVRGWYREGRLRLNAADNLRPLASETLAMTEDQP